MKKKFALIFAVLIATLLFSFSATAQLERGGWDNRYFKYNNQHPYFVGFDLQQLASDTGIDYRQKIDLLEQYDINKIRIWLYTSWFGTDDYGVNVLYPWRVEGTKFDIDNWNPQFWLRLKNMVSYAESKGIIVEVSLFSIQEPRNYFTSRGANAEREYAFRDINNIQGWGKPGPLPLVDFYPEFFDLTYSENGKTMISYQKALVNKAIRELESFGNVYYEIMNEGPGSIDWIKEPYYGEWANHMSQYIKARTNKIVTVHSNGFMQMRYTDAEFDAASAKFWDKSYVDGLNFHFYSTNPNEMSRRLNSHQLKGKLLINNEGDGYYDIDRSPGYPNYILSRNNAKLHGEIRHSWAHMTSGGYFQYYHGPVPQVGGDVWIGAANAAQAMRNIVEKTEFWNMKPVRSNGIEYDNLVSQGAGRNWQVIANEGKDYLVYFWGTKSSQNTKIKLLPGTYKYEWYDSRKWKAPIKSGTVTSIGGITNVRSPSIITWNGNAGIILVLSAVQETLPPPPPESLCGNNICESSENEASCPQDCKPLLSPPPITVNQSCQPTAEICDGIDNDCDNSIDEFFTTDDCREICVPRGGENYNSARADGYKCCGDSKNEANPYESIEVSCDGNDNDCDGEIDEGCANINTTVTEFPCKELWVCGEWPECTKDWQKYRECTDKNNCGTEKDKPRTIATCVYLGTCDDGLKNIYEEDIDCGGVCAKKCLIPSPTKVETKIEIKAEDINAEILDNYKFKVKITNKDEKEVRNIKIAALKWMLGEPKSFASILPGETIEHEFLLTIPDYASEKSLEVHVSSNNKMIARKEVDVNLNVPEFAVKFKKDEGTNEIYSVVILDNRNISKRKIDVEYSFEKEGKRYFYEAPATHSLKENEIYSKIEKLNLENIPSGSYEIKSSFYEEGAKIGDEITSFSILSDKRNFGKFIFYSIIIILLLVMRYLVLVLYRIKKKKVVKKQPMEKRVIGRRNIRKRIIGKRFMKKRVIKPGIMRNMKNRFMGKRFMRHGNVRKRFPGRRFMRKR